MLLYEYAVAVDLALEQLCSCQGEGIVHFRASHGIDQKQYTAATASAANLPGDSTCRPSLGDERFNRWGRHPWGQCPPHLPLFVYLLS